MTKDLALPTNFPAGSIEAYIGAVQRIPMLSADEERGLAELWQQNRDVKAARRLVLSHLRFVVRIARGYTGYGLGLPDLIQEGNVGLMKAVRRFDPTVGVRLVSFAVHWIRAEIHEFILRNWRAVKVATTKAQRKLFFNLRSSKKRLGWFTRDEIEAVAKDLGVKPETVLEMEARMSTQDLSFDGADDGDDDDRTLAPSTYLADLRLEPSAQLEEQDWKTKSEQKLYLALDTLDERSRAILQARWLDDEKQTLHQLAERFGVSAERIRQLERNALNKLRGRLAA